jgi:hypothetical protein
MKRMVQLSALAFFAMASASCDRCQECHCQNDVIVEVCKDNFHSKEAWKDRVEDLEEFDDCECRADIWW